MRKSVYFSILSLFLLSACVSLSPQERNSLKSLKAEGITPQRPIGIWERPANPALAGLLNLLPGIGNFYLASGNAAEGSQWLYGSLNLLTWPLSIIWGVPEGIIDAQTINDKNFVEYYVFDKSGKESLRKEGFVLETDGTLRKID